MGVEGKKKKILTTEKLVQALLEENEMLRNNDNALIIRVYTHELEKKGIDLNNLSFAYVLNNIKEFDLPPMESITRTRRNVQKEHPELESNDIVGRYRAENEKAFYEVMR